MVERANSLGRITLVKRSHKTRVILIRAPPARQRPSPTEMSRPARDATHLIVQLSVRLWAEALPLLSYEHNTARSNDDDVYGRDDGRRRQRFTEEPPIH